MLAKVYIFFIIAQNMMHNLNTTCHLQQFKYVCLPTDTVLHSVPYKREDQVHSDRL